MIKGTYKDIAGKRYGRLIAIKRVGQTVNGQTLWLCRCDCGYEKVIRGGGLSSGQTKSCGCWNAENIKTINKTHGDSYTRLYKIWTDMKKRCSYFTKNKYYYLYGQRGIKVCDEWKDNYLAFREWSMQNGYRENLTIDRINNDGDYEPSNCQWSDLSKQTNNKRSNIIFEFNGVSRTMIEWCKIKGLSYTMVKGRYRKGWDLRDLFNPAHSRRKFSLIHYQKRQKEVIHNVNDPR